MKITLHREVVQYAELVRKQRGPDPSYCPFALEIKLKSPDLFNRYVAVTHNQIIIGNSETYHGALGNSEFLDIYDLDENAIKWIESFDNGEIDWSAIDNGQLFKTINRKHISREEYKAGMLEHRKIMDTMFKSGVDEKVRNQKIREFKL